MDEQDLKMYKAFKSVVKQGDFNIKGDAVNAVSSLFQWFDLLEGKIATQVNIGKGPSIQIKELKDKDKKNG